MPKQQNDTAARPRWNRLWRQRPTPRSSISPNKMNRAAPYLFLAPSLAGLCVFVLVPFADAVRRSFTDAMGSRFVGFANYASVLGNSAFRLAAGNTARFIGVCVPLLLCVSLLLAVAVRAAKDGGRIFKTTYLIPMAIPVASIVLLWQALFHRQGLVNAVLSALGAQPVDFMGTDAAFWVLIGTYVWKNAGYDMILWMAGLDGISDSLYEAARVDGAGAWQCFWRVTLPGLLPTLFMTAVLSLLNTFKVFREAYLVGGAYPHDSIYLLQHLFNNWFLDLDVGRLCAAAVLIAAVSARFKHANVVVIVLTLAAMLAAVFGSLAFSSQADDMAAMTVLGTELVSQLAAVFPLLPALAVWWPLWFMGTGALMPLDELRAALGPVLQGAEGSAFWPLLPSWPTLQPLAELLLDTPQFFTMFWNTCAIAFPQVLGQVLVGAPAAWAFSRLRFRGRRALFTLYIVLMLMPFQVTMVSGYLVADAMGIMDTFWAIILPGVFSTFPVFIMAKGFDAVPIALLEAASIDGAGPLRTFFHIGVPLGVPGILSAAVLGFLEAWNAIEQPMTFLKTKALWPLSLYLPQIAAEKLGLAMVASLVMLAPAVLIFRFGQKYLELGIQASGLKE